MMIPKLNSVIKNVEYCVRWKDHGANYTVYYMNWIGLKKDREKKSIEISSASLCNVLESNSLALNAGLIKILFLKIKWKTKKTELNEWMVEME